MDHPFHNALPYQRPLIPQASISDTNSSLLTSTIIQSSGYGLTATTAPLICLEGIPSLARKFVLLIERKCLLEIRRRCSALTSRDLGDYFQQISTAQLLHRWDRPTTF